MQERPNVFISATSADLGSYRRAVRDILLDAGVHPDCCRTTLSVTTRSCWTSCGRRSMPVTPLSVW